MKNLLYISFLFSIQFAFGQSELPEGFGDYRTIENPEAGEIYYQMYVSPSFEIKVWKDSVLRLEDNEHLLEKLTLGVDYKINTEIVEIIPPTTTWTFEMPKIDTTIEQRQYIFYSNCEKVTTPNPNWQNGDTIVEKVLVKPKTMDFIPIQNRIKECCGMYHKKYYIAWLALDNSEQYINQRKIVHKTAKSIWLETIADTVFYEIVNYQPKPYKAIKSTRNAKLDTIQSIELLQNVALENPVYSTVHQRIMVEPDDFSPKWIDYLCPIYSMSYRVLELQKALKVKGYDVDLSNKFDNKTKWNLIQFQKEYGLQIGSWGKDIIKALNLTSW